MKTFKQTGVLLFIVLSSTLLTAQERETSPVTLEKITESVQKKEDDEFMDFHARRLVEIAGNIIMGHLLILDEQRDKSFKYLAELFIKTAMSENNERISYIKESELRDLGTYRQVIADYVND